MSSSRTIAFLVLLVVAIELTPYSRAVNEVPLYGQSDIKYLDSSVGSTPDVVTLPSSVHHAQDRSGNT